MTDITAMPEMSAPTAAPADASLDVPARTIRDDLRDFIGPNAEAYLRSFDKKQKRKLASFSAAALLVPLCWMMYRKMYVASGGLLLAGLVISLVFPHFSAGTSVAVTFGIMGKSLYLAHAEQKIRKISARHLPLDEHVALLRRAGGVSWLGATIGAVITLTGIAGIILSLQSH